MLTDSTDAPTPLRIRDLQITVWEVYAALHWQLGSPEKVLSKYPKLSVEDLAAVEAYVAKAIQGRSSDPVTGRQLLPKTALKHGQYYKGRCAHATVARWNAVENQFYYWREKFGHVYLETMLYPTDEEEPWWEVFNVVEELPQHLGFEIPFYEDAVFSGSLNELKKYDAEMWSASSQVLGTDASKR